MWSFYIVFMEAKDSSEGKVSTHKKVYECLTV